MENKSFKKTEEDNVVQPTQDNKKPSNEITNMSKTILTKDEEIRQLKLQLSEAQKVNKLKKGDIRAEVNRQGDPKLIKIGVDNFGKPVWKKANSLTDSDIERRNQYIENIKQLNAKKY